MPDGGGSEAKEPTNIGELRQRLRELRDPWTPDRRLTDNDALPDYARGGEPGDMPEEFSEIEGDLDELLKELPPTNPLLRRRWDELGLLAADESPDDGG